MAADPQSQEVAIMNTADGPSVNCSGAGPMEIRGWKDYAPQDPRQWARLKPTIKRLYIDENKTLKDVIEIMKLEHGFDASPKMYKTRLIRWGFLKNSRRVNRKLAPQTREGEEAASMPLFSQHDAGSRSPVITFIDGAFYNLEHATTARWTAMPKPIAMRLPDDYRIPSHIFSSINSYMWGSYGSGRWTTGELASAAFYQYAYSRPSAELINSLRSLADLLQAKDYQRAGPLMRLTAMQMENILRDQPVDLLSCLLEVKLRLQSTAPDLVASLMRYSMNITKVEFPSPEHPVRLLTRQLATLIDPEVAAEAYEVQLKIWQEIRDYGFRKAGDSVAMGCVWITGLALAAGFQEMPAHLIPQLDDMMVRMSAAMEGSEWCQELFHTLAESGSIQLFTHDSNGKVLEISLQLPGKKTKVVTAQSFARYKLAHLNARCQHFSSEQRAARDATEARLLLQTDMGSFFMRMAGAIQEWLEAAEEHDRAAAVALYREQFLAAGKCNDGN